MSRLEVLGDASGSQRPQPRARLESEFRTTGLVQQSTGKMVAKRSPRLVVKWSPNCVLHRVQKNEGGGKEVTERRPLSEGKGRASKKGKTIQVFVLQKSVPHCFGDDFFASSSQPLFSPCRVTTCLEAFLGTFFFRNRMSKLQPRDAITLSQQLAPTAGRPPSQWTVV